MDLEQSSLYFISWVIWVNSNRPVSINCFWSRGGNNNLPFLLASNYFISYFVKESKVHTVLCLIISFPRQNHVHRLSVSIWVLSSNVAYPSMMLSGPTSFISNSISLRAVPACTLQFTILVLLYINPSWCSLTKALPTASLRSLLRV